MTYWLINAGFLLAAAVLFACACRRGPDSTRRTPRAQLSRAAALLTAAVLLTLTAVFDNIMISVGLVDYGDAQISGIRLGVMPVEDFSYTVFAVLALPALWTLLGRRMQRSAGSASAADTAPEADRSEGERPGRAQQGDTR
ncbi:lycopene cyclase domain-containing protein [Brevibacterium salitolerans]|uniref:Lycopene cyclase domain-containing protein n=1 Tax=Brevibacterium salitolerans TaxID=1403566 RepID=A0ABN2WGU2_9MICO